MPLTPSIDRHPAQPHEHPPALFTVGGCALAFLASVINVHFIHVTGYSVSHLTGDIARFSVPGKPLEVGNHLVPGLGMLIGIALAFVFGAALAGAFIHHPRFSVRRPYGRTFLGIAGLLAIAALLEHMDGWSYLALPVAAVACGLQNAMATHYRGLVLRTTHITGVITDFGQMLGMRLSGRSVETWKLRLHGSILLSFTLGGIVGFRADVLVGSWFLLLIAGVYATLGLTWIGFRPQIQRWFPASADFHSPPRE